MRFSQVAGTTIVPTLARLILGLAFVSIGWCKLTEWVEISPEKADRLMELGVDVKSEVSNVPVSLNVGQAQIVFASLVQEAEPETKEQKKQQEQPPKEQTEEKQTEKETAPPVVAEQDEADVSQETPEQAEDPGGQEGAKETVVDDIERGEITTIYRVRRMHSATYALDKRGFTKYAKYIALTEAITEFAGGLLILLGLFSRLWGFALGGAMLGVLYFKSMGLLPNTGNPLDLALSENLGHFNILIRHLSLFVLAFGVMLTGPGPISLDRLLFKREPPEDEDLECD